MAGPAVPLDRVHVPKAAELVAAALRRQIVRGQLKEGDALPHESVLMATFAVSRPTLREAFRVLESERLIRVRRGAHGGARVHVPDSDVAARFTGLVLQHRGATVADVLEARALIEPPAAAILARRGDPKVIAALTRQPGADRGEPSGSRRPRRGAHGFSRADGGARRQSHARHADPDAASPDQHRVAGAPGRAARASSGWPRTRAPSGPTASS